MLEEFIFPLLAALSLGILVGAERERIQRKNHFEDFAGIRTFALVSSFGFLSEYVDRFVPHFFLTSFVAYFVFVITTYCYNAFSKGFSGITTEISAILTFLVGFLCHDHLVAAVIIGILLPLVMSLKDMSHGLMEKISDVEFFSTLKFCIIAFVVLPLLPDHTIDPWRLINPAKLWQTVVFISGVSFLGYVLMKTIGLVRGSRLTGLFGGLASSTAVTVSFGQESREISQDSATISPLVTGLMLAVATSFIRIAALTWITNTTVAEAFVPRIALVAVVIVCCALVVSRLRPSPNVAPVRAVDLGSPFSLWKASQFALILMGIILVSELGTRTFGERGIYIASVLSGMAKGDGIAVAVAAMVGRGTMDVGTAVSAILVSVATSFVSKTALARLSGTGRYAKTFGMAMAIPFVTIVSCLVFW